VRRKNVGGTRAAIQVKTLYSLGEIDHVKTYQEDHKNKAIRDWFASSLVVREKEAPLLP
jgi:hypothetical protein